MTRALIKKQMMEVFSWLFFNRKTGKSRSKAGTVLFGAFYFVLIFGVLGSVFYMMASALCGPLMEANLSWLYWAIIGIITVALGVFGSVFNTYASMYQAKDNDLLLSMPIAPSRILAARLTGVYLMGVMYELVVIVPALIPWFMNGGSLWALQLPVVISVLVLSLSCILGWVVALIASRMRHKNFITVVLTLAFIVVYYYLYANAYNMLASILADPSGLGEKIKGVLYPFYQMGLGASGSILSALIFALMVAALFAVVYLVLARSFIRIATANKGTAKKKYRAKAAKASTADAALLKKEMRRFVGSANYMLNCGLGIIMMAVGAVALLIFKNTVNEVLAIFGGADVAALMAVAAICMMTSMCDMSAPSVSLEGKSIWIAQSLPVSAWQVLKAKLKMHLVLTLPPAVVLTAAVLWVIRPAWYFAVLIPASAVSFVAFMAFLGLAVNLKAPNLDWTSEIVPIKQSMSVLVALLGGWAVVIVFGVLYFAVARFISAALYLTAVTALLLLLSFVLLKWTMSKGAKIFETL